MPEYILIDKTLLNHSQKQPPAVATSGVVASVSEKSLVKVKGTDKLKKEIITCFI